MQLYGTVDDALAVIERIRSVLPTVQRIVMDPYFFDVAKRVDVLYSMQVASAARTTSAGATPSGLKSLIQPLDALIYLRKNPWAFWAGVAGIVAVIGGIGYRMGQRRAPR